MSFRRVLSPRHRPLFSVALAAACAVLAFGASAAELPPEGSFGPRPVVAKQDGAPIRSEPGFLFRELRHLRAGQEVLVDERRGDWLHVRPEGWVHVDHVRPRPEEAREAASQEPPTLRIRVTRQGSRVRQGPGTGHPVVDTLSAGTEVEAMGLVDGWYRLGPGRYLFAELAEVVPGAGGPASRPGGAPSAVGGVDPRIPDALRELPDVGAVQGEGGVAPGERRRWSLMDLNGSIFEVAELSGDEPFVRSLRQAMAQTGVLEEDWTFLRLLIYVPPGPYDFQFDPQKNDVVVTDRRGERYGNVYPRGPVQRLPAPIRQFFAPQEITAGERYEGVLLFRPTLDPKAIDGVEMKLGGRLQRLFDSPGGT